MYLPLAERLYKDIQSMNLFDVFLNKSLLHGPFRDVFEGMLKTKPFDEFESLILRKHQNIRHFVHATFSVEKPIRETSDIIECFRLLRQLCLLCEKGCDVESDSVINIRVISWIINYGHTHLLQEIVNHVECNKHSISLIFGSNLMENTRLLLLGCCSNTLDMVELILKYVDPKCIDMHLMSCSTSSYKDFHRWNTPLTVASETGNLCVVKALLRNHAAINKYNFWKQSPLLIASIYGQFDVVKCLLSSGADINLSSQLGKSPLFAASFSGHYDVVKCLLSSGADINLCDKQGNSPFFFLASEKREWNTVKFLLSSGADINLCDDSGRSPLFIASLCGHCDVVKCLLSSGADINLRSQLGRSPLFAASLFGHCDVVKCLLSSGADINLCDKD
jgi:ankyrin repeat protein